ncbi:MAG TPA: PrgI family protein [Syntrophomonas sp.]|jgi:hypothetical protein|nr:PrgI family protein [Syntrophomonas sp.]
MYLIPRNISNRFEFFPGWGWQELIMLLIGLGTGVLICFLLGLVTHSPARFIPVLLLGAIGYMATKPIMADGSTAIQIIRYMQRYNHSQKLYLYQKGGF